MASPLAPAPAPSIAATIGLLSACRRGHKLCRGIQQTRRFPPVPLAFPAQANPVRCPVSTAVASQPARRDGGSRPPGPKSPPGTVRGQRQCGNAASAAPIGPKVGADKGTTSASSSHFGDLANGVHLLGSSWNNKLYHPKKQNHKRGSACSPAHKSPLSGGPPRPPISRRKLNLTKINSAPSPALSRSLSSKPRSDAAQPDTAAGKLHLPAPRTPGASPTALAVRLCRATQCRRAADLSFSGASSSQQKCTTRSWTVPGGLWARWRPPTAAQGGPPAHPAFWKPHRLLPPGQQQTRRGKGQPQLRQGLCGSGEE